MTSNTSARIMTPLASYPIHNGGVSPNETTHGRPSGGHHHHQHRHHHHQPQHTVVSMERVLYNLHHKCCTFALDHSSTKSRSWAEYLILVVTVCGFGALLLAHVSFVARQHVVAVAGRAASVWPNERPSQPLLYTTIPATCLQSIPGFSRGMDVTHLTLIDGSQSSSTSSYSDIIQQQSLDTCSTSVENTERIPETTCQPDTATISRPTIMLSYSREKGYLLLSPESSHRLGLQVQYVHVSKSDASCFGEPFLQTLVFSLLGPDTPMMNWLLGTYYYYPENVGDPDHTTTDSPGFIYNPRTREMTDLSQMLERDQQKRFDRALERSESTWHSHEYTEWRVARKAQELVMKLATVIKTSFLFFITTTLVSFTLRETQARMLDFTHHLQAYVRANRPVTALVTTHVVENLIFVPIMIGTIFFLVSFYRGDKFLAFMVLSLVWVCESFSIVSLRTEHGIHFFPRIFFLLFAIFHFYTFSFPFGFSYAALATSIGFMMHSMLFFWHRYELPAVVLGRVSRDHPRQGGTPVSAGTPTPSTTPSVQSEQSESGRNSPNSATANNSRDPRGSSFGRSHSVNTFASGLLSRNSSTNGMFHQGDDEDDQSYSYFLGGEVVMHRPAQRLQAPLSPVNTTADRVNDPANVLTEPRRNLRRFVSRLETHPSSDETDLPDSQQEHEPSSLQSILNDVMVEQLSPLPSTNGGDSPLSSSSTILYLERDNSNDQQMQGDLLFPPIPGLRHQASYENEL